MSIKNVISIPGYQIHTDSELGKGGYGTVFSGEKETTKSPVAVKTFKIMEKISAEIALHEVASLRTIRVPNKVNIRYAFQRENELFVVMDKAPGISVNKVNGISYNELSSLSKQLFEFLYYIRLQKKIHFDLKPKNLMWDTVSKVLTVIDFGSVQEMDKPYNNKLLSYSLNFCAPELLLGMKQVPDYDLWSAGCIIHSVITGLPFVKVDHSLSPNDKIASWSAPYKTDPLAC